MALVFFAPHPHDGASGHVDHVGDLFDEGVEDDRTLFMDSDIIAGIEHQYHKLLEDCLHPSTNLGNRLNEILTSRVGDVGELLLTQFLRRNNKVLSNLDKQDVSEFCETVHPNLVSLVGKNEADNILQGIREGLA